MRGNPLFQVASHELDFSIRGSVFTETHIEIDPTASTVAEN